jgi:chemotaxis protein MotD
MNNVSGTTGQLFAGLAESLGRGTTRSANGAGAKSADDSSFHDLLHTVSNLAKRALSDQGADAGVQAGALRTRLAQLAGTDQAADEAVQGHAEAAGQPKSPDKSSGKSSDKQATFDRAAGAEVDTRTNLAASVGQELAAAPAMKSPVQSQSDGKKDASARDPQPFTPKREVQGADAAASVSASVIAASAIAPAVIASSGPRPQVASAQATAVTAPQGRTSSQAGASAPNRLAVAGAAALEGDGMSPDGAASAKAMPGTPGFETVTADVERAAKASARDALPETTKVTVVQQETHLPPVPQFSATQQVANAVVAELKGSSAASSAAAATDPSAPQANAPDQPLRILTINLEPAALGNVTVRLRLVGSEVSVQLAAERKDTSQMLDQQRDSIRGLMQSAGYVADVAPVQHGALDGYQFGSGQSQFNGQQQQQSAQSHGAFSGSGASSGQADGGARQDQQQPNQETRNDQDVAPRSGRGPVYL